MPTLELKIKGGFINLFLIGISNEIMKMKNTNFANGIHIFALVVLSILLVSCQVGVTDKGGKTTIGKDTKATQFESTQELKKFYSAQEGLDYIKGSQGNAQYCCIFYFL